ncbi:MAG: glycosyltransferase [Gammaproteobacteria bacterium]|nr:glycosyltransferase [Gammaproteobacteria bacterium]
MKEEKVILFISRLVPYKKLDLLLQLFCEESGVAVVVVGPGIEEKQAKLINETPHYYYLGAKYGREINEIYNMGDVFSTPGHIGLALIQAFFWGKPVVLLNTRHAPEIFYMKNGKNGYLVESSRELKEKILYLLRNEEVCNEFSRNARDTIDRDADISKMFGGFREAVDYCTNKNQLKL